MYLQQQKDCVKSAAVFSEVVELLIKKKEQHRYKGNKSLGNASMFVM